MGAPAPSRVVSMLRPHFPEDGDPTKRSVLGPTFWDPHPPHPLPTSPATRTGLWDLLLVIRQTKTPSGDLVRHLALRARAGLLPVIRAPLELRRPARQQTSLHLCAIGPDHGGPCSPTPRPAVFLILMGAIPPVPRPNHGRIQKTSNLVEVPYP
ncbi:hypothetical protein VTJ04DRAFT_2320 [Mycothermus thermophilus]|uniref:uncharacterized protein n=1 Tax=Humicola insolens TaxID=85995 RepID=UPI0037427F4D